MRKVRNIINRVRPSSYTLNHQAKNLDAAMTQHNTVLSIPEPGRFELVERPYPKIKPGYAIVRTEIAPICLEGSRIWANHDFEELFGGQQLELPGSSLRQGVRHQP